MRHFWSGAKRGWAHFWRGLREWSGDAAYEKYLGCTARRGQKHVLSPGEFYVEQLNKKYSRPNRCC
jgi:Selenoprotein, putative